MARLDDARGGGIDDEEKLRKDDYNDNNNNDNNDHNNDHNNDDHNYIIATTVHD